VGLLVDRVTRFEERHHVGDRVVHDVSVAVGLQVQRLVEIHRTGWIDGDELEIGQVALRQPGRLHRRLGGLLHLGRELLTKALFLLDRGNPGLQIRCAGARALQHSRAHRFPISSGTAARAACQSPPYAPAERVRPRLARC
jgi:hypothetical protein